MAKLSHRIFAGSMAGLFFVSAVAFSGLVVYDMIQSRKQQAQQTDVNGAQTQQKGESVGKDLENYTPVETVSELQTIDIEPGNGAEAKAGDTLTVEYTGAVAATGKIFESSKDSGQPATFPLDQVIPGWQEGMPGMKEGGTRRLIIPAEMAYGANPPQGSSIPPNAGLVFDVKLIKVEPTPQESPQQSPQQ